jgi:hypothetical protein
MRSKMRMLAAAVLVAVAPLAAAQVTGTTEQNKGQALVAGKIASNYTNLAGSKENSLALVNALRTGTAVNLVTEVPPPAGSPPGTLPTTTTTTFTPPTKPMGWGNVKHALALAQDQLARAGITDPTAAQLQTALMGGNLVVTNADGTTTTTAVKGVLTMRADGMGWGNIAKEGGTKLGHVAKADMSANTVKSTSTPTTTTGVTTAAAGTSTATTTKSKGITTAAGGSATPSSGKGPNKGITTASGATATHGSRGLVTASGASAGANPSGNAYGRGIVNAGGGSGTNVAATGHGKGHTSGSGAGVVTGGGGSASSGITSGGGNAGGNGKGQGGGNGKGKGG